MLGRHLPFLVRVLYEMFFFFLCMFCCLLIYLNVYLCYLYVIGPESDGGILPRSLNVIFNSIEGRIYSQNNIKPLRCVDFTRLTKEQQDEDATNKRNLLRRFKDVILFLFFLHEYNILTYHFLVQRSTLLILTSWLFFDVYQNDSQKTLSSSSCSSFESKHFTLFYDFLPAFETVFEHCVSKCELALYIDFFFQAPLLVTQMGTVSVWMRPLMSNSQCGSPFVKSTMKASMICLILFQMGLTEGAFCG